MKLSKIALLSFAIAFGLAPLQYSMAQDTWSSLTRSISAKGYEGHRFRLQALVRAEVEDDSASARLWARVDKAKGVGFFDNMELRPVRSNDWKTYTIEGTIDTGATNLVFGALAEMNGKFYYDDFKVQVETKKNKWQTVFTEDFENTLDAWKDGIAMGNSGVNNLYNETLQQNKNNERLF